jgi:hypothetical protein
LLLEREKNLSAALLGNKKKSIFPLFVAEKKTHAPFNPQLRSIVNPVSSSSSAFRCFRQIIVCKKLRQREMEKK